MKLKNKARVHGIALGTVLIAVLIYLDRNIIEISIAEWIAGEYEPFLWLVFWLLAVGWAINKKKKQMILEKNKWVYDY